MIKLGTFYQHFFRNVIIYSKYNGLFKQKAVLSNTNSK